ncbi:MAG: ORF6N domain-containing protein [Verrucomicrobiota bacterium]
MYQLKRQEFANLSFQVGTSSLHGGGRHMPCAFTKQGIAMLSSVLRNRRAVAVNTAKAEAESGIADEPSKSAGCVIPLRAASGKPAQRRAV